MPSVMELSGPKDSSTRHSFCPSLHVRQTPSLSTLIKGPKLLHHLQQRAGCPCRAIASQQRSPSSISCSPEAGVTVPPCTYQTGSGLCCHCTHCCALARRDIRVSLVVSFLWPLSSPSNRDITELFHLCSQPNTACKVLRVLFHSSFLHYNEILLLVSSALNEGRKKPSMCTYSCILCHSQWLLLELSSFSSN